MVRYTQTGRGNDFFFHPRSVVDKKCDAQHQRPRRERTRKGTKNYVCIPSTVCWGVSSAHGMCKSRHKYIFYTPTQGVRLRSCKSSFNHVSGGKLVPYKNVFKSMNSDVSISEPFDSNRKNFLFV